MVTLEKLVPVIENKILKEPLKILDIKGDIFVLYGEIFKKLQDSQCLPENYLTPEPLNVVLPIFKEPKIEELRTQKYKKKPKEQVFISQAQQPVQPLNIEESKATKTIKFHQRAVMEAPPSSPKKGGKDSSVVIKELAKELMKSKENEVPLHTLLIQNKISENYSAFCREIRDFNRVSELGENIAKYARDDPILMGLFEKHSKAVDENHEVMSCFESDESKKRISQLSEKRAEVSSISLQKRAPLKLICEHTLNPQVVRERAAKAKALMPKGPLQLVCGTNNCSYIINDSELAYLLGDYFQVFFSNYNEPLPNKPEKLNCMMCSKAFKIKLTVTIHKNHVTCFQCIRNYIMWLNQDDTAFEIDKTTLKNPNGPKFLPIKCPARACSYKFPEVVLINSLQPTEFICIMEMALNNLGVPNTNELLEAKKIANSKEKTATRSMLVVSGDAEKSYSGSPKKQEAQHHGFKKMCEVCKNDYPVETIIGLFNCEHFLCESDFKRYARYYIW